MFPHSQLWTSRGDVPWDGQEKSEQMEEPLCLVMESATLRNTCEDRQSLMNILPVSKNKKLQKNSKNLETRRLMRKTLRNDTMSPWQPK